MRIFSLIVLAICLSSCGRADQATSSTAQGASGITGGCSTLNLFSTGQFYTGWNSTTSNTGVDFQSSTNDGCIVVGNVFGTSATTATISQVTSSTFVLGVPTGTPTSCTYQKWAKDGTWDTSGNEMATTGRTHYINVSCAGGFTFSGYSTSPLMTD